MWYKMAFLATFFSLYDKISAQLAIASDRVVAIFDKHLIAFEKVFIKVKHWTITKGH